MQTHSYLATVQVDFEYDHSEISYDDARMRRSTWP